MGEPNPNFWSAEAKKLEFQRYLLVALRNLVLDKKFGADIVEDHLHLSVRKAAQVKNEEDQIFEDSPLPEIRVWNAIVNPEPLVDEIGDFEKLLDKLNSIGEVIDFASKQKLFITDEDIKTCEKIATECVDADTREGLKPLGDL